MFTNLFKPDRNGKPAVCEGFAGRKRGFGMNSGTVITMKAALAFLNILKE
ncbi:MAG TPA: hypothetical protein VGB63_17000 [Pedobacter sp.]